MSDLNFDARKARILAEIESPTPDLSPKGFIDVQILPLISRLNVHQDVVTTSSCSGRVSVFVEGAKDTSPRVGGKGDGGRWLFVDHDPVDIAGMGDSQIAEKVVGRAAAAGLCDVGAATRFVHFKFETMILHILARDLATAQKILSTALSAGFRESGVMNSTQSPMVAIRSNGLALDAIIGVLDADTGNIQKLVSDEYIAMLVRVGNMRFQENDRRIEKLTRNLEAALFAPNDGEKDVPEDKEARRLRKREEGLRRQQEQKQQAAEADAGVDLEETGLDILGEILSR